MLKFFGSYSVKKNGKRNIATKQKNGKSNMQKTQNPFSVPKLRACTKVIQLCLQVVQSWFS